jgi:cell division protein FtsZ
MAEIITLYGDVNIDIADANTCLRGGGNVLMCTGRASGLERAKEAVEQCFQSPLLENRNICGARQILLDIHSSSKHPLTMKESDLIRSLLQEKAGGKANLIWGNCTKEELDEDLEIVVVASQFSSVSLETKENKAPEEEIIPQPPSEDKLPDESQTVVRYRGKDRYSKMDEIYKVPAFKRYSDIFDSALSTPAPKKSIVDDSIEPTASESKMSSEDSSLSLF